MSLRAFRVCIVIVPSYLLGMFQFQGSWLTAVRLPAAGAGPADPSIVSISFYLKVPSRFV